MKHGFSMLAVAVALMTALSAARAYVSAPVENESYPPPCISENANCSICGTGIGFTDKNNDGICDNRNSHRTGNGQGHKHGCKRGNRQ